VSLRDLLALYVVIGIAIAIAVVRRAPSRSPAVFASAIATIPLWPLWAPFALAPQRPRGPRDQVRMRPESDAIVSRVERALSEAVAAVEGTPMADVFPAPAATRIASEVAAVAARLADLTVLAEKNGFDPVASARQLEALAASGASDRALATARLQHESLERLDELRAADARALEELAGLVEALRMQLVLARYAGNDADGASAIVSEVWARLEGLGAALDPGLSPPDRPATRSAPAP